MTPDDPKLTAYALDELEDGERAEVEAFLKENEAARRFVEETRQTVAMLSGGLQSIEAPALTAAQRDTIRAAAGTATAPTLAYARAGRGGRGSAFVRWSLAAAACAALVAGGYAMLSQRPTAGPGVVVIGPPTTTQSDTERVRGAKETAEFRATVATLIDRSQEQIRKRNYKAAMGILDQVLQIDPNNDYARGARPLVNDNYLLQQQRGVVERAEREKTQSYGESGERTIPYEDILRYPENWPDISKLRDGEKLRFSRDVSESTRLSLGQHAGQQGQAASANPTWGGDSVLVPIHDWMETDGDGIADLGGQGIKGEATRGKFAKPGAGGGKFFEGMVKGTGTLTLTGNNSYSGTTAVDGGGLKTSGGTVALNGGTVSQPGVGSEYWRYAGASDPRSAPVTGPQSATATPPVGVASGESIVSASTAKPQAAGTTTLAGPEPAIDAAKPVPATILQRETEQKQFSLLSAKGGPGVAAGGNAEHFTTPFGVKLESAATTSPSLSFATASNPTPQAVEIRRDQLRYKFTEKLKQAQEAVGRRDTEAARVALGDIQKDVELNRVILAPDELAEVQLQLHQVEATIPGTESYARLTDNPFKPVAADPLSTFSIDVDTASYSNVRRFITQGQLPPPDAVRIEELLNYFPYNYDKPASGSKEPFKTAVEVAACPWNAAHRLARVAIKGREIAHDKRPVSNLVLLIDVSGSMNEPRKLPLVKAGLKLMVNELTENDRVAIVVYAGAAGLVLPSTCADPKEGKQAILKAIEELSAGGSTAGAQGVELAYQIATENFIKGGTNRVLLATDGDWNVGITDKTSLFHMIKQKAESGVFLSVLGYGMGNTKDDMMEGLADKGNGHYAYIDDLKESRKVLVEEMSGTLVTIAKDVKIQVEFNPAKVESYRLIGYENRVLRNEDFNNDKIDAGEIGAGHCVTALYEITPVDLKKALAPATATTPAAAAAAVPDAAAKVRVAPAATQEVDPLKYQKAELVRSEDLLTLKLRYKQPDGEKSTKLETPVVDQGLSYAKASEDFKFAAAVAQYGMILRNSPHKGTASLDGVIELADEGKGKDEKGLRGEFVELVKKTKQLIK